MASFYLPESDEALAQAIASASGGMVVPRPLSRAVEVHGQKLTVTREMVRVYFSESGLQDVGGMLERTTWEMLKRNANGLVRETETTLTVEGATEAGGEPKRGGCLGVLVVLSGGLMLVLLVQRI